MGARHIERGAVSRRSITNAHASDHGGILKVRKIKEKGKIAEENHRNEWKTLSRPMQDYKKSSLSAREQVSRR